MIAKMSRIEIICLRESLKELLPFLQERGVLEIEEVPLEAANIPDFLKRAEVVPEQTDEVKRDIELDRLLRETVPLLIPAPAPAVVQAELPRIAEIDDTEYAGMVRSWHRGLRALARRRTNARDNLDVLNNYKKLLKTLLPILGSRTVNFGENARAVVLQGDNVTPVVENLTERLKAVAGSEAEFIHKRVGRKHLVGVIIYPPEKNEGVARILREEGIVPVDAHEATAGETSLPEAMTRVETQIKEQTQALADIESAMKQYAAEHGPELVAMHKIIGDKVRAFNAVGNFAESEMLAVIHAWAPSDELEALKSALNREFDDQPVVNEMSMKDIPHNEVPTLLKNPYWLKPFEVLLMILRPPTYGTYDATGLVAFGFILFYGMIVGDFVYGCVIFAFAHWLRMKWGHNEIVDSAGKVGYAMAVSAMIFGIAFGEYWGNAGELAWTKLTEESHSEEVHHDEHGDDHGADAHAEEHASDHGEGAGEEYAGVGHGEDHGDEHAGGHGHLRSPPLQVLHRMHQPTDLLVVGILIGLVHITLSLLLGIRESLRHHHTSHAIEKAGMLMGMLGIVVVSCNVLQVSFFAAPAFVWVGALMWVGSLAPILYAMGPLGFVNFLEIFSLCGNILSYARLMALGIAGVVIADMSNNMALGAAEGGFLLGLIGFVASIAIHLFNIALIMFSPTLHSLRLNYVEFLPKFYEPEGRHFNPFKKEATW